MKKQEIKKQIDDSVKIFREMLERTYLKRGKEFYGIEIHWFSNILCGEIQLSRKKNGNLRISGELGKEFINKKCEGLPRNFNDWEIFPLVVTLFNKDIGVKNERNKI